LSYGVGGAAFGCWQLAVPDGEEVVDGGEDVLVGCCVGFTTSGFEGHGNDLGSLGEQEVVGGLVFWIDLRVAVVSGGDDNCQLSTGVEDCLSEDRVCPCCEATESNEVAILVSLKCLADPGSN
jgi:hypothetical protein